MFIYLKKIYYEPSDHLINEAKISCTSTSSFYLPEKILSFQQPLLGKSVDKKSKLLNFIVEKLFPPLIKVRR